VSFCPQLVNIPFGNEIIQRTVDQREEDELERPDVEVVVAIKDLLQFVRFKGCLEVRDFPSKDVSPKSLDPLIVNTSALNEAPYSEASNC